MTTSPNVGVVVTLWANVAGAGWFWHVMVEGREAGKGAEQTFQAAATAAHEESIHYKTGDNT